MKANERPTSEVVTTDVDHLGALGQRPDLGLLQMLQVIVVRGAEEGAERPVVAGDDNTALAGADLLVDAVLDPQADSTDGVLEDGGVLVVADTADVDYAVGGQDVLGAASGVLGGAAGNQLGFIVCEEVLVDGEVRVLGEDGVVGLEVVLGQEGVVAGGLDVWSVLLAPFAPRAAPGSAGFTKKSCSRMIPCSRVRTLGKEGTPFPRTLQYIMRVPLILTKERVLQTEESVFFSGSHFSAQLIWSEI